MEDSPLIAPSLSEPRGSEVAVIAVPETGGRLEAALEGGGLRVTARVRAAEELEGLSASFPAAVVLQVSDLGRDMLTHIRRTRRVLPEAARLIVVAPAGTLRNLRELLAERVDALVLEEDVERCLALAVRSACEGLLSFSGSLRGSLATPVLSTREKQVLGMVVLGFTNGEIASKLHLAESTVKSHLSSSFTKLGVKSRSEAAALILDPATGLGTGILAISEEE
jgi:DNA-binding NarL/FixJ family response regulator